MAHLLIGVGQVSLIFRHSRSLKDKRRDLNRIEQKLRNEGFSVTECAYADNPKRSIVGFATAGRDHGMVDRLLEEAMRVFIGDFEVVQSQRDVFDYTTMKEDQGFPIESFDDI